VSLDEFVLLAEGLDVDCDRKVCVENMAPADGTIGQWYSIDPTDKGIYGS